MRGVRLAVLVGLSSVSTALLIWYRFDGGGKGFGAALTPQTAAPIRCKIPTPKEVHHQGRPHSHTRSPIPQPDCPSVPAPKPLTRAGSAQPWGRHHSHRCRRTSQPSPLTVQGWSPSMVRVLVLSHSRRCPPNPPLIVEVVEETDVLLWHSGPAFVHNPEAVGCPHGLNTFPSALVHLGGQLFRHSVS